MRAELNGGAVLPTGTFADNVDGSAVGASAFIGGRIPNSPFVLGSELGFYNYRTSFRLSVYSTVFDGDILLDQAETRTNLIVPQVGIRVSR